MIFFAITVINEIIKFIAQNIEDERRYNDTLEFYGPSIGYERYEPSVGYKCYEPRISYERYEPRVGYERYEPKIGYERYEPSVGYKSYEPSIGYGSYEPSIGYEHSEPSIDYEFYEPRTGIVSRPREQVREKKVTKSSNAGKVQVSKDNKQQKSDIVSAARIPKQKTSRPNIQVQQRKSPNVGNAQVSTKSKNSCISVKPSSRQTRPKVELIDLLSVPSHWSRKSDIYEVHEEELKKKSSERKKLNNLLSGFSGVNITRKTRVQNPFLYYRYQLRKEEYEALGISFTEKTLLHDTCESKVSSILKNNLDWRLVKRYKFGKGVSFSPDPLYANTQSSRNNGSYRAIIVAKVIVGRSHGGCSNLLPKDGYDTTTGNGAKVVVKYYDDEFYPEYVVYYNY